MVALMVVAYALMLGIMAWVFVAYRKRVARPEVLGRVAGLGSIVTALSFTAVVSEAIGTSCGAPSIVVMGWPAVQPGASAADNDYLASCVNTSGLQVSAAIVVQLVNLVVVALWASRLMKERRPVEVPYEPMYPGAVEGAVPQQSVAGARRRGEAAAEATEQPPGPAGTEAKDAPRGDTATD